MRLLVAVAPVFVSLVAHATSVAEDVERLRRESFFAPQGTQLVLRGTSQRDGGECWAQIRLSSPAEYPGFYVSVRDAQGGYTLALVATPLDEKQKTIASDYVAIQESRRDPDDTGYVRYAKLQSFHGAGQPGAYPTEVTVGENQLQPRFDDRSLRCYSLEISSLKR